MLHQLRWRKSPPDHGRLWMALGIALVLHVFFVIAVWHEMKPRARQLGEMVARQVSAIQVRLIVHAASKGPAAPPPIVLTSPPRPAREPVSKNAMTLHMPGPAPTPASPPQPAPASSAPVRLFDQTGRIVLPANASSAPVAPTPDYVQRAPQGDTQIMHDKDPVKYKPTALDPYWRKGGSGLDDVLQKAVEKTTVSKTIQLPMGIRIRCSITFAALGGGCGGADPPPPPPPTDGDERLNMAPASLIRNASTPKAPDVASCIADYRAGKPLPYGCPVDTPTRAVDAEKHVPQAEH
ncbi:hypothetical protein [Dyella psychrodurans]|uniref:Uncharacterized protein n=1 Tax=Dyella psychrodurans TaxID=1927960 RepID=A0A370XAS3_9GAMM|nr:hypothetical protein [Dyella psychrodurans]RDS85370.1 hypothetical protein DWU99_07540 [Dyella psychrodurans]